MGITRRAPAIIGTILIAALTLAGCTSPAPAPSQAPRTAEISPSGGAAPNEAIIFEVQKASVEGSPTRGTVLKQYSGTGPATISIGPLPKGHKKLGTTVLCSGTGDWKVNIVQDGTPGWGSSGCSLSGGSSIAYPVANPAKDSTVKVDVAANATLWVTVYSTK